MSTVYASLLSDDRVSVAEPISERQVVNNAGGFVFALDAMARLQRFLILGSDAPTYYQSARTLSRENAKGVVACWAQDPEGTAALIAAVSVSGRAPRVASALFALALGAVSEDLAARRAALAVLPQVCRTASHLFEFVANVTALGRGWGRALKNAVRAWYEDRGVDALGYQMVKYRNRNDFTHKRLLQSAHPRAGDDATRRALYAWGALARDVDEDLLPPVVAAHLRAMRAEKASELIPLVQAHDLPWEAIPTWALTDKDVQRALLPSMGLTALVRNLGTLTRIGVVAPLASETELVCDRLTSVEGLRKARVHPFALLQALAVYRSGRSVMGSTAWHPVGAVVDALDNGFYTAFDSVEPSGGRTMIALDVSGSMATAKLMGSTLSVREASAAMAMVTMAKETRTHCVGFSNGLVDLDLSPRMRLDDVVRKVSGLPFSSTMIALPMLNALERGIAVDTFVVYTDNEVNCGIHPVAALQRYRKETGIPAKLIVVAMTSTGFTVADPADAGMLDVVGFDASAPAVMADFARA